MILHLLGDVLDGIDETEEQEQFTKVRSSGAVLTVDTEKLENVFLHHAITTFTYLYRSTWGLGAF